MIRIMISIIRRLSKLLLGLFLAPILQNEMDNAIKKVGSRLFFFRITVSFLEKADFTFASFNNLDWLIDKLLES